MADYVGAIDQGTTSTRFIIFDRSGATAELRGDEKLVTLNFHGASANVRLEIEDISRRLLANLSDVHADLLEIASYVYAADSAASRR